MKREFFTLMDLIAMLCVSAVTGALLILNTGALNPEEAKSLRCRDNLKHIGEAALAYADANNDVAVPHTAGRNEGWPRLLSGTSDFAKGYKDYYVCPSDEVKRVVPGAKISYTLNTGHLWGYRYSTTTKQEWGPANVLTSPIHGNSVSFNQVEEPSGTMWFFERFSEGNTWENIWKAKEQLRFGSWRIDYWYHLTSTKAGAEINTVFMDGHVEAVAKGSWRQGDIRSVVFKSLHGFCMGNKEGHD